MRRISVTVPLLLIAVAGVSSQCLTNPLSMRLGLEPGISVCTYDADDGGNIYTGGGMHIGIGMGSDFFRLIAFDMRLQFKTTSFGRGEALGRRIRSYKNLMYPVFLALKAGMLPRVSPYIGLGIGFNIRFAGVERFEFSGGGAIENDIGGSTAQGFMILGLGAEIKLNKWRIAPRFTANISGSGDETHPPQTEEKNYDISVGFYYSQ